MRKGEPPRTGEVTGHTGKKSFAQQLPPPGYSFLRKGITLLIGTSRKAGLKVWAAGGIIMKSITIYFFGIKIKFVFKLLYLNIRGR